MSPDLRGYFFRNAQKQFKNLTCIINLKFFQSADTYVLLPLRTVEDISVFQTIKASALLT